MLDERKGLSGGGDTTIETLKEDILILTSSGERQVGSEGHRAAKEYVLRRMTELKLKPYSGDSLELPYDHLGIQFTNLVGRIPGVSSSHSPILLGAHYDTCGPIPGADDNASALAIVLLVVDKLRSVTLARDVIIAFFDAEEPPHFLTGAMGSIYFYSSQRTEEIACAVILDLMGHDVPIEGYEDLLFITGMESHSELEKVIKETEVNEKIRIVPALNEYVGDLSDHHIFRVNDIPYLFLSCGRWEHYHMPTDTPEKLNYEKMAAMADYLFNLVLTCDTANFQNRLADYDSTPTELEFMNRIFAELFRKFGIGELKCREDISMVARRLMSIFGI
jgi:hypothetical protein